MNGTMARMQDLIASQRRFIADASHQLRTPLTVLKTQAELALRENDPAAMRAIVRSIAGHHRFHRPPGQPPADAGAHRARQRRRAELRRCRWRTWRARSGWNWRCRPCRKDIDLALEADDGDARRSLGQALLLHELVSNLVDNAIRYTPPGGSVLLSRAPQRRTASLLEVQDSGPGIAAAERDKVFMPFYRAAAALESQPGRHRAWAWPSCATSPACTAPPSAWTMAPAAPGLKVTVIFPLPKSESADLLAKA